MESFHSWLSCWTYCFQDSRSQMASTITTFHSDVMVVMLFVVGFVLTILTRRTMLRIKAKETYQITHGAVIEIVWTLLPRLAVSRIALPSWTLLYSTDRVPGETQTPFDLTIKATGLQWYWSYEYGLDEVEDLAFESYMVREDELPQGRLRLLEVDQRLVVPRDHRIRVLVSARDVIHSWAVPSLGVKCDAIPGRLNQIFFLRNRRGVFHGQCSELCGTYHRFMPIIVERVSESEALAWLAEAARR
uniref:Cytochrome c oxidase subunit 2 n=1 Tax=Marsupiomonas sp. NIES 1824 TaxID=1562198 RepID=A0A6H0QZR1_9CHLO|nr:cytochrome c oxidase subunit 2 [Marsupiomonas sp. NIES 1824]